jgi:predicted acetyltransferase
MARLRRAKEEDKSLIYRWWKGIFAEDDGGHTDYYFDQLYQTKQSYLLVDEQNELISSCQVHTKTLDFNGKPLQVSFIVGVFTLPKYRGQGYMKELLTKVLEILEYRDLLTFIQGYNPNLYVPFGFEKIYIRNHYWLDTLSLPTLSPMGITYSCSALELKDLYKQFTKHFTGYVIRSTEDFNQLLLELNALGGKLIAYQENERLLAYAFVYAFSNHIEIEEMVYLNSKAMMAILGSLKSTNLPIRLSVSQKEDLSRIFPYATLEQKEYTNVRLNDARLMNELYKLNIKSAEALFMASEKPIWFRENQ